MSNSAPIRLPARFLEKVWGVADLSPWYQSPGGKIGEVWFEADLPLLVKFIFTSEALSVQVHPDDAFATAHENSQGKTEMWYVLRAERGARVGIGFREALTAERLRESALAGGLERLLHWLEVKPGDAFLLPAGTVHAIGPGVAMCEIQQHSDVTYRLYDYGRPRELHLDKALQVARLEASGARPVALPVDCEYFHVESMEIAAPAEYPVDAERFHLIAAVEGGGTFGDRPFRAGEVWLVPRGAERFPVCPAGAVKLLRAWIP